ncbi:MAG: hypothetical protein CR982_00920 [Candidatus Cloacimonadota bacterium]|nr:MAG: hypothetical protein CR982_00920 [Candidatus Cloacimonadota bacterium]PIE77774.1 MAG: hypothetical protein CSA15_11330 [Candidatus Delongbacteria bacterium]
MTYAGAHIRILFAYLVMVNLKEDFTDYYVNILVLKDASRINVIDQGGNLDKFIDEVEKLSQFLNIPIWSSF